LFIYGDKGFPIRLYWGAGQNGNITSVTDNTENFPNDNFISNFVTLFKEVTTLTQNFNIHRKTRVTKKSGFMVDQGRGRNSKYNKTSGIS